MSVGGSSGRSSGSTTQVSKTEPWSEQIPHLTGVFEQARKLYGIPTAYYPEATYARPAPETEQALGLQAQRAMRGSPLTAAASSLAARTLGGGFLSAGNPGFQAAVDRAASAIRPNLDAQFAAHFTAALVRLTGRTPEGRFSRWLHPSLEERLRFLSQVSADDRCLGRFRHRLRLIGRVMVIVYAAAVALTVL